jgi:hypothetical protein
LDLQDEGDQSEVEEEEEEEEEDCDDGGDVATMERVVVVGRRLCRQKERMTEWMDVSIDKIHLGVSTKSPKRSTRSSYSFIFVLSITQHTHTSIWIVLKRHGTTPGEAERCR